MSAAARRQLPRIALVLCALGAACGLRAGGASTARHAPLSVLVVGELRGTLEPCGCSSHPKGGIYRLGHLVSQARAQSRGLLVLGLGDLLYETPGDEAARGPQEHAKAETLVTAFERIGLKASARGPLDRGAEASAAKWRWLEALGRPGAADEDATLLQDVAGVRVGVAVARSTAAEPARAALRSLRARGAAVVLLLVRGDRAAARSLVAQAPGADFAFASVSAEPSFVPERVGGTVLLEVGTLGQHVGRLDLWLPTPGQPIADGEPGRQARVVAQVRLDQARRRLALARKNGERLEMIRFAEALRDEARVALKRAEARDLVALPLGRNHFRWNVPALDKRVPEDAGLFALRDAYKRRLRALNQRLAGRFRAPPATADTVAYLGNETCRGCHPAAFKQWKTTPHGRAFATLERGLSDFDLGCVGCHMTGYLAPGGSSLTQRPELRDVGCEACHGPGGRHAAAPDAEKKRHIARAPAEQVCRGCHTPEHSDLFDFATYRGRVVGPGHGARPAVAR